VFKGLNFEYLSNPTQDPFYTSVQCASSCIACLQMSTPWNWNWQKTISCKASTHEDVINNVRTRSISNRQSLTVLQIQTNTSLRNASFVRHSARKHIHSGSTRCPYMWVTWEVTEPWNFLHAGPHTYIA